MPTIADQINDAIGILQGAADEAALGSIDQIEPSIINAVTILLATIGRSLPEGQGNEFTT